MLKLNSETVLSTKNSTNFSLSSSQESQSKKGFSSDENGDVGEVDFLEDEFSLLYNNPPPRAHQIHSRARQTVQPSTRVVHNFGHGMACVSIRPLEIQVGTSHDSTLTNRLNLTSVDVPQANEGHSAWLVILTNTSDLYPLMF